ncbi:MAG: redoxin domain-containing protein, partial [Ginsengibacter sp.]
MTLKFWKIPGWKKTLFVALLLFCFLGKVASQSLPDFKMQLTNGKMFASSELSKSKPVIIIYFAPDCEHCQLLIKNILKRINEFKKSQIILVSFESLQQVSDFEKQYGLKSYPFIKTG